MVKILKKIGSGITLTNSVKDIMTIIESFEKREILIKETTRKIARQKGEFVDFLRPLMTAGLPL